jgi:hypothetical protein
MAPSCSSLALMSQVPTRTIREQSRAMRLALCCRDSRPRQSGDLRCDPGHLSRAAALAFPNVLLSTAHDPVSGLVLRQWWVSLGIPPVPR